LTLPLSDFLVLPKSGRLTFSMLNGLSGKETGLPARMNIHHLIAFNRRLAASRLSLVSTSISVRKSLIDLLAMSAAWLASVVYAPAYAIGPIWASRRWCTHSPHVCPAARSRSESLAD
jgi:hypothetical protein